MTVDQNPSPLSRARLVERSRELSEHLEKLKELTGISDEQVLAHALEASRSGSGDYDVNQAFHLVVNEHSRDSIKLSHLHRGVKVAPTPARSVSSPVVPDRGTVAEEPEDWDAEIETISHGRMSNSVPPGPRLRSESHANQSQAKVVDLTAENSPENDDLMKAIALSLQEQQQHQQQQQQQPVIRHGVLGGQVTAEEEDISRALEESLVDSKYSGTKRKRGEIWEDPLNPHERERDGFWPVGLKNVGNTCWFSAVVQSLFHLPVFKYLVLNYAVLNPSEQDEAKKQVSMFMVELRKLFALMVGTRRKYLDPSRTVEIFKRQNFPDGNESQQDVSEFTHKLLEWLEQAFQKTPNEGISSSDIEQNPMERLFYGEYKSEGCNEGRKFSNTTKMRQMPLRVKDFSDLHQALEASMSQDKIESSSGDGNSGQEHWFTSLPPVLLFEFLRFEFNQQLGRPEKIHSRVHFPEVIFMDRYMDANKEVIREKRKEIRRLKEERAELQARLDGFLNCGTGAKRMPLQDILQYTLDFVETCNKCPSLSADVEMTTPEVVPPQRGSLCQNNPRGTGRFTSSVQLELAFPTPPSSSSGDFHHVFPPLQNPSSHVSDSELRVIQGVLSRYRDSVSKEVQELQQSISSIDEKIDNLYQDPSLKKVAYKLHAVLVHEGQAASGHYWAYIWSPMYGHWLKFNDNSVQESTWEEVARDSVGGHHNASAYCLVYLDSSSAPLLEDIPEVSIGKMPQDLLEYVKADNKEFVKELEDWDQNQQMGLELVKVEIEEGEDFPMLESPFTYSEALVKRNVDIAFDAVANAICRFESIDDPKIVLQKALEWEKDRLLAGNMPIGSQLEALLSHMASYLHVCGVQNQNLMNALFLEHFTCIKLDSFPKGREVRAEAKQLLKKLYESMGLELQILKSWHEAFYAFRSVALDFCNGIEHYQQCKYTEAVIYLSTACTINQELCTKGANVSNKGLKHLFLKQCYHASLLNLDERVVEFFKSEDIEVVSQALQTMSDLILPCVAHLNRTGNVDEQDMVEKIRNHWFMLVGEEDLPDDRKEKLRDVLDRLLELDCSSPIPQAKHSMYGSEDELPQRFIRAWNFARHEMCERPSHSQPMDTSPSTDI